MKTISTGVIKPAHKWSEIAKEMGVNEATVRCYFKRAEKKLKRNREYKRIYKEHKEYRSDRSRFNLEQS